VFSQSHATPFPCRHSMIPSTKLSACLRFAASLVGGLVLLTSTAPAVSAQPEIEVSHEGNPLISGGNVIRARAAGIGFEDVKSFLITNTGLGNLTGLAVSVTGNQSLPFTAEPLGTTDLPPGGSVTLNVTYSPTSIGPRQATVTISSNDANESSFTFIVQGDTGYDYSLDNYNGIIIPAEGTANPYPSNITYSGLPDHLLSVRVDVYELSHQSPNDLDMVLMAPDGTVCGLMSDVGGTAAVVDAHLAFPTDAITEITDPLGPGGSYLPSGVLTPDEYPPGTAGTAANLMELADGGINGTWKLFVTDDESPGWGDITAWSIRFRLYAGPLVPEISITSSEDESLEDGYAVSRLSNPSPSNPVSRTYTISNDGYANLTGLSVNITGTHAADFETTAPIATTLAPGESTQFSVSFTPSASGYRNATLHVHSSDADENPFDIALIGQPEFTNPAGIIIPNNGTAAPYPSDITVAGIAGIVGGIEVRLSGLSHTFPDDLDMFLVAPDGAVCALMSDAGGGTDLVDVNLVFSDAAASNLPDSAAIVGGTYLPTDYQTGEPLPPGGNGAIGTTLLPLAAGGVNGTWQLFVTDDAAGDSGSIASWSIVFQILSPEIAVADPDGAGLADGAGIVAFQTPLLNTPVTRTFTIRNQGTANLTGVNATLGGPDAARFSVETLNATTLVPGANITLNVTFTPTSLGDHAATLLIASNDANEAPFEVALEGNAISQAVVTGGGALTIPVIGNASPYPSNLTVSGVTGATGKVVLFLNGVTHSYPSDLDIFLMAPDGSFSRVMSDAGGSAALVGIDLRLADDAPTPLPSGNFVGGGSYRPANYGGNEAAPPGNNGLDVSLSALGSNGVNGMWKLFVTDDGNGDSGSIASWSLAFEIYEGPATPEIAVRASDNPLTDGGAGVDFGGVLQGTNRTITFNVRNLGTGNLSGITPSIGGPDAARFEFSGPGAESIPPGGSTNFSVTFTPTSLGHSNATLHIASNDADEDPFDIPLTAAGTAGQEFRNSSGIFIPVNGDATPYPSTINVHGYTGNVSGVRVLIEGLSHTYTSDLQVRLQAPGNLTSYLLFNNGGTSAADDIDLLFDDSAPALPGTPLVQGTFRSRDSNLQSLLAGGANGDWKLFVYDRAQPDSGSITSWSLIFDSVTPPALPQITVAVPPGVPAGNGTGLVDFGVVATGSSLTLPVLLTNNGSANLTYSLIVGGESPGVFSPVAPFPTELAPGANATVNVTFSPTSTGPRNATLSISSNDPEDSPFVVLLTGQGSMPGVTVVESGGNTRIAENGHTDSYAVVLNAPPTANVTITAGFGGQISVSPAAVVFTPLNWNIPQILTVTATNDTMVEGQMFFYIDHYATSADPTYNSIGVSGVSVRVRDNDFEFSGYAYFVIPELGSPEFSHPAVLNVSGVTGRVVRVRASLGGLSHTRPDDLDIHLMGPHATVAALMSDAGGADDLASVTINLQDDAPTSLPDAALIASGNYLGTDFEPGEPLPPGGLGSIGTSLLPLAGANPNGEWKLFVSDDLAGEGGYLSTWALHFDTDPTLPLPVQAFAASGSDVEITFTATAGTTSRIQSSPDLRTWTDRLVGIPGTGAAQTLTVTGFGPSHHDGMFFRVIEE
jgi:subtilisin-like proprotein convertase family protein